MTESFQLVGQGPGAYERYLVPTFFAPCADELITLAAPVPGERALDLACGTGIVARKLAYRVGPTGTVTGTDLNAAMIATAESVGGELPGSIRWHVADASDLPMADGAFDLVCCQQGLQFFPDPAKALREAHRVLAADGRIALASWRSIEHQPAFSAFVDVLDRHAGAEAAAIMRAPFSGPDRERLRGLLIAASFTSVEIRFTTVVVRFFCSTREFLRREAVSSPLAGPVGALKPPRLARLVDDLDRAMDPYTDDLGLVLPTQTWLIIARRG